MEGGTGVDGEGWRESQLISNLHCAAVDGICLIL